MGFCLLLVGHGPAYETLTHLVARHDLHEHVIFTGPVGHEEIPSYIASMDIAVQPSAPEYACPMKIIEYMGMAKCIVAPAQPNIEEFLEDEKSAMLFTPGDVTSLLDALVRVISEPDLRVRLGTQAWNSVTGRNMSWRSNAMRALDLALGTG